MAIELLQRPVADPTAGAMWYRTTWVRDPGFAPQVTPVVHIGRHVFYRRANRVPASPGGPWLQFASR